MYGCSQTESAIALIPLDPTTSVVEGNDNNNREILSGSKMRGFMYGRSFTVSIDDCPSENPMLLKNWTQYMEETATDGIVREQLNSLVPALFSGVGTVSIIPGRFPSFLNCILLDFLSQYSFVHREQTFWDMVNPTKLIALS